MRSPTETKSLIVESYIDEILIEGAIPVSIYKFCKKTGVPETEFYNSFASFKSIETYFWKSILKSTKEIVDSEEIEDGNTHHYLLSFYFTLFENFKLNRSFILHQAGHGKDKFKLDFKLKKLLKPHFSEIAKSIYTPIHDISEEVGEKISEEAVWFQFVTIFHFWLRDESVGFEKTDLLIEKSVRVGIDLTENLPTESVLDFGKFMFKELKNFI
jgi:hypothetical protein